MNRCLVCGRLVAENQIKETVLTGEGCTFVVCTNNHGSSISFNYGIKGKRCLGRWYPHPDRISIHLNKLAEIHNPNEDLNGFIADMCAAEFHELGHIYGYRDGCRKCNGKNCYWCRFAEMLHLYLEYNVWNEGMRGYLKTGEVFNKKRRQ